MAKNICAACSKKIEALEKKIPYGKSAVCVSCAENMECLVCKNKLHSTKTKEILINGFFCPECFSKIGITSSANLKSKTSEYLRSFIDKRMILAKSYVPTKKIGEYLSVDEYHHAFKIGGDIYEYKNLLSFELIQENQSIIRGGVLRALLFGLIFGAIVFLFDFLGIIITAIVVGLLLGAITGGKKTVGTCDLMKIRLTLKDCHVDTDYIIFIENKTKIKSSTYQEACECAQSCISALEIIADYNESQKNMVNAVFSEADEILKFKKLMDDGVITKEEFEAKKSQILNLDIKAESPMEMSNDVAETEQAEAIEPTEPQEVEEIKELQEADEVEEVQENGELEESEKAEESEFEESTEEIEPLEKVDNETES